MAYRPGSDEEAGFLRERARVRLQIVEAVMRALDMGWELQEAIASSADRLEARQRLTSTPFGFTEVEAEHVLDLQFSRRTKQARSSLEDEAVQLREQLAQ